MNEFFGGLIARESGWVQSPLGNVHGARGGLLPFQFGVAHANTGGQDGASDGTEPFPLSNAGTLAAGTAGQVFDGDVNADFDKIVTALVLRNIVDFLRDKPVIMQAGSYLSARHVPGTNQFVYVGFGDLSPADDLVEGVPPETNSLAWDTQSFKGGQKGKLVAITDLATVFSPFDLYSIAAEKVAWNAIDTVEKDAADLLQNSGGELTGVENGATIAENIIDNRTLLKVANVPQFPDGTYHALISPGDAAEIMKELSPLGWTETQKYTATEAIMNGEIGKFRGVRFIESNRIDDGKTVIFGPDAWVMGDFQTIQAYRVAPGGDHADPLAQRGLVGWKGMWGLTTVAIGDGTVPVGPASNPKGIRYTVVDLTNLA